MDNNGRSRLAALGPWLGAILLILAIYAGANYLRQGQEELKHAAETEEMVEASEESVGEVEAEAVADAADEAPAGDAPAGNEPAAEGSIAEGTGAEASQPVTDTEAVTVTGDVTATDESGDGTIIDTLKNAIEVGVSEVISESAGAPAGEGSGGMGGGMGQGGMGGNRMREFHMAPIPEEYAGVLSPVPADEDSIARGEPIFQQNCAVCHGETGLGDGPAAATLDPTPPMIAMTSQNLGDDHMFWRISEGGAMDPFNSAMPTWKAVLVEEARWDVINYVRSLGDGQMVGGAGQSMGMGRSVEEEEAMRSEMLAAAIEQGIITQEQAELFDTVHGQIDAERDADPDRQFVGTMRDLQDQILVELVESDTVTQEDADTFNEVLALLEVSDLMQ